MDETLKTGSKANDCNASISLLDESVLTTSKQLDETLNGGQTVHNISKIDDPYDMVLATSRNHSPL